MEVSQDLLIGSFDDTIFFRRVCRSKFVTRSEKVHDAYKRSFAKAGPLSDRIRSAVLHRSADEYSV